MAEVLFYHLTQTPLERTLPDLLEKSLSRGWRVLVKVGDSNRLEFLDNVLWSYRDDAFLPHGKVGCEHASDQPVYLTDGDEAPNAPDLLMLVDGATIAPEKMSDYQRVCLLFDGNDTESVSAARNEWKTVVAANLPAKYWAQDDGKWAQKAEHKP